MAKLDETIWFPKFEKMGIAEVKRKLGKQEYGFNEILLAQKWLDLKTEKKDKQKHNRDRWIIGIALTSLIVSMLVAIFK